ncbi:MAG: MerR family transcriptional regulator [Desulfobaccales bacterium]
MQSDNTSQDLMLTIEQVSQLTGVRKSTLRYWEKSFEEFLRPARTHSNRREYTMEDLDLIKTIKRLLEEEHLTSEGVRLKLLKLFPHYVQEGSNQREEARRAGPIPLHAGKS